MMPPHPGLNRIEVENNSVVWGFSPMHAFAPLSTTLLCANGVVGVAGVFNNATNQNPMLAKQLAYDTLAHL